MTEFDFQKLLGTSDPDRGCDESGALMDEYCEAVCRGEGFSAHFAEFRTHIANCTACREDTESLLALLREQDLTNLG
jgi:hypothetical protein